MLPEGVKTLRDLWMERGLKSQEAADLIGISRDTLYAMNRKEQARPRYVFRVCRALGISRADYDALEKCPQAERYRQEGS